jgi:hypothetical protein
VGAFIAVLWTTNGVYLGRQFNAMNPVDPVGAKPLQVE